MTKADIAEALCEKVNGLSKSQSLKYVDLIFDQLKQTLARGETVKLSGFGKFTVRRKKERTGRNPQTGDALVIEARTVVTFAPSDNLRKTVNNRSKR